MLCACDITPIEHDQALTLGPGQGIAAVVTYVYQPVNELLIKPEQGNGKSLIIPAVKEYSQIYLMAANAGRYCIESFKVGKVDYFAKDGHGSDCFEVHAGYISFSKPFAPLLMYSTQIVAIMAGNTPPETMLRERYPLVANQYPIYRDIN